MKQGVFDYEAVVVTAMNQARRQTWSPPWLTNTMLGG